MFYMTCLKNANVFDQKKKECKCYHATYTSEISYKWRNESYECHSKLMKYIMREECREKFILCLLYHTIYTRTQHNNKQVH